MKLSKIALALIVSLLLSCHENKHSQTTNLNNDTGKDDTSRQTGKDLYEKWFVYDQPINGYNVKIHWLCDKAQLFSGTGYFISQTPTQ